MKPTDYDLECYFRYDQFFKTTKAKLDLLKAELKDYGSCCTENWVCSVYPQSRRGLASMDLFIDVFGYDTLVTNNLIIQHDFLIVKVSPKTELELEEACSTTEKSKT
jgi:hypothetical protein